MEKEARLDKKVVKLKKKVVILRECGILNNDEIAIIMLDYNDKHVIKYEKSHRKAN
ncbi:hypothetical protein [Candidatus Neoehrlichia procyonis]|uniref:Uncharacterized protein n=1 Tax=Candidatus Neoehrlichia procyonis str. RAC413 TaxID=1359163 RepID=A0A0F3NLG0_9RICK|nr:hypothetical protein [Candidatus Neoehrlichia lotoris]KJV68903.1 hypothetical protein NLO413_0274 [Candidatus Neoehrlichia lotoris str. RAC413]